MGFARTLNTSVARAVCLALLAGSLAGAATAPATRPGSPKVPVESFLRAMLSLDENGAMEQLSFDAEDTRRNAQVMLHQIIATGKLRRAIVQQFDARGHDSTVGAKEERDARDMLALLSAATIKYGGTTAQITFDSGMTLHTTLKGNVWKVDYEKSQRALGGLPTKAEVEGAKKSAAAIELLAAEVSSRRIGNLQEIESRYNAIKIAAMAPAAATAPAK
jgi:hypothetical protein